MRRGEICWYTFRSPDKRRPVLVLTRGEVIERLHEIIVVPVTRTIRGLTTEVVLTADDGMPTPCALNFDHGARTTRSHRTRPEHASRDAVAGGPARPADRVRLRRPRGWLTRGCSRQGPRCILVARRNASLRLRASSTMHASTSGSRIGFRNPLGSTTEPFNKELQLTRPMELRCSRWGGIRGRLWHAGGLGAGLVAEPPVR